MRTCPVRNGKGHICTTSESRVKKCNIADAHLPWRHPVCARARARVHEQTLQADPESSSLNQAAGTGCWSHLWTCCESPASAFSRLLLHIFRLFAVVRGCSAVLGRLTLHIQPLMPTLVVPLKTHRHTPTARVKSVTHVHTHMHRYRWMQAHF